MSSRAFKGEILGSRSLKSRAARRLQRRELNSVRPAFCVRLSILNPFLAMIHNKLPGAAWKDTPSGLRSGTSAVRRTERRSRGVPGGRPRRPEKPDAEPVSSPARWHAPFPMSVDRSLAFSKPSTNKGSGTLFSRSNFGNAETAEMRERRMRNGSFPLRVLYGNTRESHTFSQTSQSCWP
jgi:hypothetical protein